MSICNAIKKQRIIKAIDCRGYGNSQASGGIGAEHLATAGVLAVSDGPEPFIMDAVAAGYLTYVWWTHGGQELVDKMSKEVRRIAEKAAGPPLYITPMALVCNECLEIGAFMP